MITQVFAIKQKMTQAWTKSGKRLAVTCLNVVNNAVVGQKMIDQQPSKLEIGFGKKKLKNMTKPLKSKLDKSGFSFGVRGIREVAVAADETLKVGDMIRVQDVLQVGDVVNVQGVTKGRGFAGAMKRHGFAGGPKTHGQSDRWRAVGSIGQRTTPGRVFKGKRMPGHYGVEVQSVAGLVVLHVDPETQEVWLSGPVPGHIKALVTVSKTGRSKEIEIDRKASGLAMPVEKVEEKVVEAETTPVEAATETVTESIVEAPVETQAEVAAPAAESTETTGGAA
jgi:large subunit ribosomal protein L3